MKLLDRHQFTNDRAFEVYLLEAADIAERGLPEYDVIGLRRISGDTVRLLALRPDEALILARLLIEAVRKVTASYEIDDKGRDEGSASPDNRAMTNSEFINHSSSLPQTTNSSLNGERKL